MHIPTFIERKRDGHELSAEDITEFIRGCTSGEVPDYQTAAWAMAGRWSRKFVDPPTAA